MCLYYYFFFFFQAEDGIRDRDVTGVQTCALPICPVPPPFAVPSTQPRQPDEPAERPPHGIGFAAADPPRRQVPYVQHVGTAVRRRVAPRALGHRAAHRDRQTGGCLVVRRDRQPQLPQARDDLRGEAVGGEPLDVDHGARVTSNTNTAAPRCFSGTRLRHGERYQRRNRARPHGSSTCNSERSSYARLWSGSQNERPTGVVPTTFPPGAR